jgi:hypothetical protein
MAGLQGEPVLFADGYDDAIIGLSEHQPDREVAVVYDYDKCVRIAQNMGMSHEDAVEFVDFNVVGSWVGEHTPIFIRTVNK